MVFTRNIAALVAASASLVAAVPTVSTKAFTIDQVASDKKVFKSGPIAYKNALSKFHATVPEHVQAAADGSQQGSAEADPQQYDAEYLVPVTVGGQSLTLDFDTGSADLWVFSTETPSNEVNGQATYNPSSGSKLNGETWSISYGDGSGASGDVYADTVVVGGVTATGQAVEAATSVSSSFASNSANDGLLGLAFSSINTVSPDKQTTFFDTVSSSLASPIFAVTLKHQQPGSYDFGYIDNSKYTGDLVYTSVDNSQGFWSFTADSTSAGGSVTGIADTGTTLILLDDNTVSSYYSGVSGAQNSQSAGGYVFDCNTTPPDFTVTIAGTTFTVPGSYINFAPNGDGTCFGGIQSSGGIGFSIFGDVFLKAVYVVFDSGNTQLGFAAQA